MLLVAGVGAVVLDLVHRARHPRQCAPERGEFLSVRNGTMTVNEARLIQATTRQPPAIPPPPIPLEAAPQHRKEQSA